MKTVQSERPHGSGHDPPHTRSQKRKCAEEDSEYMNVKRYRLTEKNLRRHRHEEKEMGKRRKTPTTNDSSSYVTTNTTTTDRQFGPRLTVNGVVFEQARTVAPDDLAEVKAALAKVLPPPVEADGDFEKILQAKEEILFSELSLESAIIETMLMKCSRFGYHRLRNDQWTEVENEVTAGISDPKPDVVETYGWSAYPAQTREDFEDLVPTQYGYSMPTFAMISKGEGDPTQAVKQAAYDGAIMTHASIAAGQQMEKKDLYGKTKAITVTLTPSDICVYANFAVKDQTSSKVAYHQYRVERVAYIESIHDWKRACNVINNAQTFAQNLADTQIQDIKKYFDLKDERLKLLKAERDKIEAQAKAEHEKLQADAEAEREKRQAQAKLETTTQQTEAKAAGKKGLAGSKTKAKLVQTSSQAEVRPRASMEASRKSLCEAENAADKVKVQAKKQSGQAAEQEASIDVHVSPTQAKVCV